MSVLHPVSISAHSSFLPFSNTAATSLVEYLPPELQANCLLLGGGDFSKILYTLFAEKDNGLSTAGERWLTRRVPQEIRHHLL
jgi:hypothetical protein